MRIDNIKCRTQILVLEPILVKLCQESEERKSMIKKKQNVRTIPKDTIIESEQRQFCFASLITEYPV